MGAAWMTEPRRRHPPREPRARARAARGRPKRRVTLAEVARKEWF